MNVDGKKPGDSLLDERDKLAGDLSKSQAMHEATQKELARERDKVKTLESENYQLRVVVERNKGADQAREEMIDKLIDKPGDR